MFVSSIACVVSVQWILSLMNAYNLCNSQNIPTLFTIMRLSFTSVSFVYINKFSKYMSEGKIAIWSSGYQITKAATPNSGLIVKTKNFCIKLRERVIL